jgi:hypothetical protein
VKAGKWLKLNARLFTERFILRRPTERIYAVIGGHIFFQTLRSAIELELFDILQRDKGATLEKLAARLHLSTQPLRILLLVLVYLRLLRKKGDRYYNTYAGRVCFCSDSPRNINHIVRWQHSINYAAMPFLLESLREYRNVGLQVFAGTEPTLYERLSHDPHLETIFQQAMVQISRQANRFLNEYLDLRDVRLLVDIGGGVGENVLQLVAAWPHLRAGVFDLPSVCERAERNFDASVHRSRLVTFSGNCFSDPLPSEPDAYILCHFMTIWSKAKDLELLRKCFDSLPNGGRAIIFNMMQNDDEDGPAGAAMGSPYFLCLATGEGMLYTWREYEQMVREAGFARVESHRLPMQHGIIIGVKSA